MSRRLNCKADPVRASIQVLVGALLVLCAGIGHAQDAKDPYPNRAVRVIVPFAAGGPGDLIARLLAQKLTESFGKKFYTENHPGAGGNIGTGLAARAPADGYTVLVVSSTFMINASLYQKIPYDPIKDFEPVTIAATTPNVLVAHPSVPAKTVKELIDLIRAGKYDSYAMPGAGTPPHMSGELFKQLLKLDLIAVPFGGGGPMIQSVVAGHTPIGFSSLPPAAEHIKVGLLRALAVTSAKRIDLLPDVPTLAEAGFPDQEGDTPQGILVPAGTPRSIIDRLYQEITRIVAQPDLREKMAAIGFEPVTMPPEAFAARIRLDIPKWGKLIRDAKIKAE
jgi:tripartite-type tricarboxylate transporter receptor subunit TctC